jgi:hypothetical protein
VDANSEVAMVAMLSASLALVRPVGMTEQETDDWLSVAVDAVQHIPIHIFERGVRTARQTCTHHSQIVPAIIAATREAVAWFSEPTRPVLRLVSPEEFAPTQPLPDPETLNAGLQRIGLLKGWIVEGPDGLEWAKDSAA